MATGLDLLGWLRTQCAEFVFLPAGVYVEQARLAARRNRLGRSHVQARRGRSPLTLASPLPKESAALANVIEVALVDFLLERLDQTPGTTGRRGEERSYPDLEIGGDAFGGTFHAVDVKMARLAKNGTQTQSRCCITGAGWLFTMTLVHLRCSDIL